MNFVEDTQRSVDTSLRLVASCIVVTRHTQQLGLETEAAVTRRILCSCLMQPLIHQTVPLQHTLLGTIIRPRRLRLSRRSSKTTM